MEKMEKKLSKKTLFLGILLFILNIILLFAVFFIFLELSQGLNTILYITQNISRVVFLCGTVIILSMIMYGFFYFECRHMLENIPKTIECFVLLDISLIFSFLVGKYLNPNARPFAFLAVMAATLLGRREGIFMNVIFALMVFVIDITLSTFDMWTNCACLLITFCAGMTAVFATPKIKFRLQSILLVLILLIPIELIVGVMEIIYSEDISASLILLGYGALGALFSILMYMILLPIFEVIFSELTVFRLRELTSDDARLIKKLKAEAPGTYNHSVVVAQLAEACANAIGEDGELARAAAYYHDVGKLKKPEMFTENQHEYNMHNEFSPELSADIIRSHTRDGAALIRKYHLPEFFADAAIQHHGTLPIKYFYMKALRMSDGEINIANYSYTGPVPQTRIAAILMIADASEAAARSLTDRSPASVEALVRGIIEERINLEQFVNCDITMRELSIINQTIAAALSGVYHSRISYPKLKISKKKQ
jgi:hypothetical protein